MEEERHLVLNFPNETDAGRKRLSEVLCEAIADGIAKGKEKSIVIDKIARSDYSVSAWTDEYVGLSSPGIPPKVKTAGGALVPVEFDDLSSEDKYEWYCQAAHSYQEYERVKSFVEKIETKQNDK